MQCLCIDLTCKSLALNASFASGVNAPLGMPKENKGLTISKRGFEMTGYTSFSSLVGIESRMRVWILCFSCLNVLMLLYAIKLVLTCICLFSHQT